MLRKLSAMPNAPLRAADNDQPSLPACAADAACAATYGDVEAKMESTLAALTMRPLQIMGTAQVLDAARPRAVHAGDALTLRADFTEDSAESYVVQEPRGNEPPLVHPIVETLSVSWFSTAGTIAAAASGGQRPDVTLKFDAHLPASVALVDLWAVGRDERGGTSYLHRTLDLQ